MWRCYRQLEGSPKGPSKVTGKKTSVKVTVRCTPKTQLKSLQNKPKGGRHPPCRQIMASIGNHDGEKVLGVRGTAKGKDRSRNQCDGLIRKPRETPERKSYYMRGVVLEVDGHDVIEKTATKCPRHKPHGRLLGMRKTLCRKAKELEESSRKKALRQTRPSRGGDATEMPQPSANWERGQLMPRLSWTSLGSVRVGHAPDVIKCELSTGGGGRRGFSKTVFPLVWPHLLQGKTGRNGEPFSKYRWATSAIGGGGNHRSFAKRQRRRLSRNFINSVDSSWVIVDRDR